MHLNINSPRRQRFKTLLNPKLEVLSQYLCYYYVSRAQRLCDSAAEAVNILSNSWTTHRMSCWLTIQYWTLRKNYIYRPKMCSCLSDTLYHLFSPTNHTYHPWQCLESTFTLSAMPSPKHLPPLSRRCHSPHRAVLEPHFLLRAPA